MLSLFNVVITLAQSAKSGFWVRFFSSDFPVVSFQLIFFFPNQFIAAHSKVYNVMALALPVQAVVFIMSLRPVTAHPRMSWPVQLVVWLIVRETKSDSYMQNSRWICGLTRKKKVVSGCSVIYQWLGILLPFETYYSFLCFHVWHNISEIRLHLNSSLLFH